MVEPHTDEVPDPGPQGWCVCGQKVTIADPREVTLPNGRPGWEGHCPECGSPLFAIRRKAAGDHRGAQRINEPSAYSMSFLRTPDPEGAKVFYGAVLGWTTEAFGPMLLWRLSGYVGGVPSSRCRAMSWRR